MGYYGSFGQTPGSGISQTLPSGSSGGSIIPAGGSGISPAGGAPAPGSIQSWSYAPIVIAAMQQNYALFTAPRNQKDAWHAFAVQLLISGGYMDPGRESDAQGAVYALSQAYGYYWMPGSASFQLVAQADQQGRMQDLLNFDLSAIAVYKQLRPPVAPGITISSSQLRAMWAHMGIVPGAPPPGTAPPVAPPASSTPWLLLGGVAAAGAAVYFLA